MPKTVIPPFTNSILDGRMLASYKTKELQQSITTHINHHSSRPPCLAVIQIGDNPASVIYVKNKRKRCIEVGVTTKNFDLSNQTSEPELCDLIQTLNEDNSVDGILVQLPLPEHISSQMIIEAIDPAKDVDGFHPLTIGRLLQECPTFSSCTPKGILQLLNHANIKIQGLNTVIIGASSIVGKPLSLELLNQNATVTICHIHTKNLEQHIAKAELLVVAIGKPGVIKTTWIPQGCIIIDVGINRLSDGSIVGDIDFNSAKEKASWITPVPGGVGPMTIITLLENTFLAYKKQMNNSS